MNRMTALVVAFAMTAWIGLPRLGLAAAEISCAEPVATAQGPVTGQAAKQLAACTYLGIPYAAPPVGKLRWQAPAPAFARAGVYAAGRLGPSCIQDEHFSGGGKSRSFSEDCLSLNIFRPAAPGRYPVMFWIHGGGFTQGAGSYAMYEGSHLAAERGVVVVSINYRLGSLGFLALPELAAEDPHHSTGNYGLADAIFALAWVRENIAAFGGDPQNVTIFGESAGGVSVCSLLAAEPAAGLFHRGVIESGGCDLAQDQAKGFEQGRRLAEALGCSGDHALDCLRALPADRLVTVRDSGFSASAHVDGYVLKDQPIALLEQGKFNRVPVMVGSNKDEFTMVLLMVPGATLAGEKQIRRQIEKLMGPRAAEILALYSFDDYPRPVYLAGALTADGFGSRAFAAAEAASAHTPVYLYRFDWDEQRLGKRIGAFHGLEIPLVFGNLKLKAKTAPIALLLPPKAAASAAPLSGRMMDYWTNFAKTGDPNGPGLPDWPKYDRESRKRIYLDREITAAPLTETELKRYRYFASLSIEDLGWGEMKEE